ncbi:selenium cofactor biosynthesis protein YqeC [Dorea sp. D27]|uniref:selenium cofactor biosynthesis protein YqeC n=1 Tax=Dorea sp. D27 TaxID=658665 RepID=UPI000673C232|nr:selenium cofactor biosynthesis protein YqeC [Dorea sp. D27]KMZ53521.1 putative selenium-dependent hydroxylase accessory protein YqeC [Dorea sp. D27]
MIRSYGSSRPIETESLKSALSLARFSAPIISVVGAGGKTTVIRQLAREYEEEAQPVIVTTTTHMWQPDEGLYLRSPDLELLYQMLKHKRQVWAGYPEPDGKMSAFPVAFLEAVRMLSVPVIIEADGAKGQPVKVPEAHEPVLWGKTMVLLGVAGLDAVGGRIEDVCHHPERASAFLGKGVEDVLECEDIVKIGLSDIGMKKSMDPFMKFHIVLNKADDAQRVSIGDRIAGLFAEKGFYNVIVTSGLGGRHECTD